jgi:hypothetical protein
VVARPSPRCMRCGQPGAVVVPWLSRGLPPLYLIAPSFNTIPGGVGVAFDGDALTAVAV